MRTWCLLLLLLWPAGVRAAWKDVRIGMSPERVIELVGAPLLRTRSRNGTFETWTYDFGGNVAFVCGRVSSWQPSRRVAASTMRMTNSAYGFASKFQMAWSSEPPPLPVRRG